MLSRLDTLELIPLQRAKSLSTRHLMGYSPQQFLDERCQACQVLTFTSPEANLPWQHMGEKRWRAIRCRSNTIPATS
ncbi:hypothetical protein UPYG_G00143600 [Umbra pygmaea]|uniref:Uncharacterized protein n=1 Tax=Umbra pygmaea TaxID=75934 RepID=A0ABD0WVX0_UMBPY